MVGYIIIIIIIITTGCNLCVSPYTLPEHIAQLFPVIDVKVYVCV